MYYGRNNSLKGGSSEYYLDAVASTKPYVNMDFGMGTESLDICMTQHAANKYCQWLSSKTGHFYRLPTEAEWNTHSTGTTTAYSGVIKMMNNLNAKTWNQKCF